MRSNEPFRTVCAIDPAIDPAKCSSARMIQYCETRDLKLLEGMYKIGVQPMVFRIRQATRRHETYITSAPTDDQKNERAFACLVEGCDSFRTMDGRQVDKEFTTTTGPESIMSEDELESVPYLVRQEIGQVALQRALFLLPWREPKYLLPLGSASVLDQTFVSTLLADESPESSTSATTETSSKSSTGTAETSAGSSGAPTDATAQETA